jgi:acyl-CoA synthetase (AMP-forming)/AMP-acid ligase II
LGQQDFTLYDIAAKNARVFANREALFSNGHSVTFRELLYRIDNLASELWKGELKKGDRIAIIAQNSLEFFLFYGAAAKLGAIIIPINWRLTTSEIEYIIADGTPKFIFSGPEYQATAKGFVKKFSFIDKLITHEEIETEFSFSESSEKKINPKAEVLNSDPFLIIHTAAVSGKPKGATISHENIVASALQTMFVLGLGKDDSYLQLLPLFHIAGIVFSFSIFYAGGRNVLLSKFDPEIALEMISKERISFIGDFPPILEKLLSKLEEKNHDISPLKHVVGLDHSANIEKLERISQAKFWTGFGQSETSGMVTISPYREKPGSAGKEGPLVNIKLMNDQGQETKTEEPGEICAKGPLVFMGYWNRDEENRHIFREGWHHTGDIGRFDEAGYLWYVARKPDKELIKSGGENIYPAEVEKIILDNPEVAEVSVIGVPDLEWGEAIKAICVLKPESSLTSQGLINSIAARIAGYKKPKYIEFVFALPKAADGSIDREKVKVQYGQA